MEEGEGDHRHQAMSVQPCPRSAFEVIKPELFLELLMCLFADPSRLDRRRKRLECGVGRQVRQIIFLLSARAPFADQPDFLLPGHGLDTTVAHAMPVAVGHPYTASSK